MKSFNEALQGAQEGTSFSKTGLEYVPDVPRQTSLQREDSIETKPVPLSPEFVSYTMEEHAVMIEIRRLLEAIPFEIYRFIQDFKIIKKEHRGLRMNVLAPLILHAIVQVATESSVFIEELVEAIKEEESFGIKRGELRKAFIQNKDIILANSIRTLLTKDREKNKASLALLGITYTEQDFLDAFLGAKEYFPSHMKKTLSQEEVKSMLKNLREAHALSEEMYTKNKEKIDTYCQI